MSSLFQGQPALSAPEDPLVSADDFAEWFKLGNGTAGSLTDLEQARIQTALEVASAECRAETNQRLTYASGDSIQVKPTTEGDMLLPEWPVAGIDSLVVDGQAMTDGTDYQWNDRGIVTPLTFCLLRYPPRTILVTYSHGWNPLPRDIAGVCLARAKRLYDALDAQTVESETLGSWSVKYAAPADGFTPGEKYTLARYTQWTQGY